MTYAFKLFFPVDDSVMCSRTMTSLCALYWVFKCFSLRATFPYRLDGLVVRASAFQKAARLGFKSHSGHTKDLQNGSCCLLVWCSA